MAMGFPRQILVWSGCHAGDHQMRGRGTFAEIYLGFFGPLLCFPFQITLEGKGAPTAKQSMRVASVLDEIVIFSSLEVTTPHMSLYFPLAMECIY